jgi:hypothetical protein
MRSNRNAEAGHGVPGDSARGGETDAGAETGTNAVAEIRTNAGAEIGTNAGETRVGGRTMVAQLNMTGMPAAMPVEWLDSGSWRLPSGKALAEFALQAGFLAPLLLRTDGFDKGASKFADGKNLASARGKQFGKGGSR